MSEIPHDETSSLLSNHNSFESRDECIVCMNSRRNIKFIPCGHDKVCFSCYSNTAYNMKDKGCPYCKQKIEKIVYLNISRSNSQNDISDNSTVEIYVETERENRNINYNSEQIKNIIWQKFNIKNNLCLLCTGFVYGIIFIIIYEIIKYFYNCNIHYDNTKIKIWEFVNLYINIACFTILITVLFLLKIYNLNFLIFIFVSILTILTASMICGLYYFYLCITEFKIYTILEFYFDTWIIIYYTGIFIKIYSAICEIGI